MDCMEILTHYTGYSAHGPFSIYIIFCVLIWEIAIVVKMDQNLWVTLVYYGSGWDSYFVFCSRLFLKFVIILLDFLACDNMFYCSAKILKNLI